MSQFVENYDCEYANETRTFEYRNIRVREYKKKMYIPSTNGKNKPTQNMIDRANLSKGILKRMVKNNKIKKVTLKGLEKSKVKKYKKWIRQVNKKIKVTVK